MDLYLKLFDFFTIINTFNHGYPSFGLLYTRYFCKAPIVIKAIGLSGIGVELPKGLINTH